MRFCVYGIAKDEAEHVARFMKSIAGKVPVVICDTGSADGTPELLRSHGAEVHEIAVVPWRFDLARNMALSHVPEDVEICISMDLDEVLLSSWHKRVKKAWRPGTTILRYPFVHNWQDAAQTVPRLSVWGFKVHARHGYVWKYPIHETLERVEPGEKVSFCDHEIVRHYPDPNKRERWGRIALLEMAAKEYADDQRMSHLYGRELWFHSRYEEAIQELKRHLSITQEYPDPMCDVDGIAQTRSTTCHLIARCLGALGRDPNEIAAWMLRGVSEYPSAREPWIRLAQFWQWVGDNASAYACAKRGMAIVDRKRSVEIEEDCWDERVERLVDTLERLHFDQVAIGSPVEVGERR